MSQPRGQRRVELVSNGRGYYELRRWSGPSRFSREEAAEKEQTQAQIEDSARSSLSRTRRRLIELAMCNPWRYFVTVTVSPDRVSDRSDYARVSHLLASGLRDLPLKLPYLLVPEHHRDGALHFHGFIGFEGLPYLVDSGKKSSRGETIYNCPYLQASIGFNSLTVISDPVAAAIYCSGYAVGAVDVLSGLRSTDGSHSFGAGVRLIRASHGLAGWTKTKLTEHDCKHPLAELSDRLVWRKTGDYAEVLQLPAGFVPSSSSVMSSAWDIQAEALQFAMASSGGDPSAIFDVWPSLRHAGRAFLS